MERINLTGFGPLTRFDAAHIVDGDGRIVATVAEPENREDWDEKQKREFIVAVKQEVDKFEDGPFTILFDPGRDNCEEVLVWKEKQDMELSKAKTLAETLIETLDRQESASPTIYQYQGPEILRRR